MDFIHGNKLNKLAGFNLLHDILNPPTCTKILNIHYFPTLQGYMDTQKGKAKFKNFRVLLNCGCIYTILMGRIIQKLNHKENNLIQ